MVCTSDSGVYVRALRTTVHCLTSLAHGTCVCVRACVYVCVRACVQYVCLCVRACAKGERGGQERTPAHMKANIGPVMPAA